MTVLTGIASAPDNIRGSRRRTIRCCDWGVGRPRRRDTSLRDRVANRMNTQVVEVNFV